MSLKTLPAIALNSRGADYNRMRLHVDVDPSATLDDILRPSFWAHHVDRLNVKDIIEIVTLDLQIDIVCRVIGKGIGYVTLDPLSWHRRHNEYFKARFAGERKAVAEQAEDLADEPPAGYTVSFAPKQKWRVIMTEPHTIVSMDHPSKADAIAAAIEHAGQALGRAA